MCSFLWMCVGCVVQALRRTRNRKTTDATATAAVAVVAVAALHIYANTHSCIHTLTFSVWRFVQRTNFRCEFDTQWFSTELMNYTQQLWRAPSHTKIYFVLYTHLHAPISIERAWEKEKGRKTHNTRISFFGFSVRRQFLTRKHWPKLMYNTRACVHCYT